MTQNDPVIDDVREVRHRISECFDHDPERLIAYYMEFQQQYRVRLLDVPQPIEAKLATRSDSPPTFR